MFATTPHPADCRYRIGANAVRPHHPAPAQHAADPSRESTPTSDRARSAWAPALASAAPATLTAYSQRRTTTLGPGLVVRRRTATAIRRRQSTPFQGLSTKRGSSATAPLTFSGSGARYTDAPRRPLYGTARRTSTRRLVDFTTAHCSRSAHRPTRYTDRGRRMRRLLLRSSPMLADSIGQPLC